MDRPPRRWLLGARPHTLPASVVPVALGACCAVGAGHVVWWRVPLAAVVSVALQVGVNFANDYSDGVRGTDDARIGPTRLVASGAATGAEVRRAAWMAFGVAAVAGLALAATTSWWLVAVGVAAVAAAWGYTGGPKPYGYMGLGELFVFVFFGLVATIGTTYVAIGRITALSVVMGCAAGTLACALLVVNNLRDRQTDIVAGKGTLAVRLGSRATRRLYVALIGAAFALTLVAAAWRWPVLIALAAGGLAVEPVRRVRADSAPRELLTALAATGRLQLAYGLLASIGLALGS